MKVLISLCLFLTAFAHAEFVSITLPSDNTELKTSDLPGYELAKSKCHLCHAMDYVFYQPPGMDYEEWTAEMYKMRNAYGAPISMQEAKYIAAYLAVAYGSATKDDPEIVALTKSYQAIQVYKYENLDALSLMSSNDCLACRVSKKTLLELKSLYERKPNAVDRLAYAIKTSKVNGHQPPFNRDESEAIAIYILSIK